MGPGLTPPGDERPGRVEVLATCGAARAGRVHTPRGGFDVPCFMPVGTQATVKTLSPADLDDLGVSVVLANTYHLMLRPGPGTVAALGGLGRFMGWDGHVLTDSGGFQVFSLQPSVDDEGVTFRSIFDGSSHRLTPERAVEVQRLLGADIQMVLDVCPALPAEDTVIRQAVERTTAWAARARRCPTGEGQALFGIVQGGTDPGLRAESARRTVDLDFDGYGIGGLSVGESRAEMLPALAAAVAELPADRVRYLMGVGDPARIVEAVALGVDTFDCVLPTRLGRHGSVLTGAGRLNLARAEYATDDGPLDPDCPCAVCARWSRGYLRHLLSVREPSVRRLLSLHNLAWTLGFVRRLRNAVLDGTFERLRRETLAVWG